MAEFKLERFKYNWKGVWTGDTAYKRDDIVRVNGKSYVCIITHVASTTFRTDLDATLPGSVPPQPQPKWVVMTNGLSFIGDWTTATDYNLGDIVTYNGSLWVCTINHNAANFAADISNWTAFTQTTSYVGSWQSATDYAPGAVVSYNGNAYKCITANTSSSKLEDNIDDWELYRQGTYWKGEFLEGTEYRINDFVKYGGTVFRCTETHTSSTALDDTKFITEIFGSEFDGTWSNETYYNVGDIVRHEGFMYYAVTNNNNSKPYTDSANTNWILLARNINFVGSWAVDGLYKTGDVVLRGGNLYLALRDIGGVYDDDGDGLGDDGDGSSLDYLEPATWELMVPGKSFKGVWALGTIYSLGSVVVFKGTAYTCNTEHETSFNNFPGDNGSGYNYWDILIQVGQPAALEAKGDLLTYGPDRLFDNDGSTIFDDSSFGDTRLAIGVNEQILSVSSTLEAFWRDIQEDADSIFVSSNGIDDENRGTFQKPFKTIRYAAEYVEDNFTALSPVLIRVSAGKFEEISPIVVPAGCAINGDELRSTTVLANSPLAEYENDFPYVQEYIEHLTGIIFNVATGIVVTPQQGNTETQITEILEKRIDLATGLAVLGIDGNPVYDNVYPTGTLSGVNTIVTLFDNFENYIDFNINSGSTNPTLIGSNTLNTVEGTVNTGKALLLNRKFLQQEVVSYLNNEYPDITFTESRIKNDVYSLLRAIARDTKYSGNYAILLSAQRYANAVTGSATSDLFYMRDTTGLRDMTTGGLKGVLNPPGVFELYQKPTGGALVSLDPGWGPTDERTWIKNRSPYIQGVTNTGTGCIGMKVDGALHSGGNKSMTANDFTQVLSDGIGAWVTNNARAELVSVFTYYCQVGYFAEDGGIIRAANGNNSYGKYGSIADGIDDTEIPQTVAAFNQNNEATVIEAFAGGATDELMIFEYSNAGEEYTNANVVVTGAGANASVEFSDFRDGGLFEQRLISGDGSSKAGGAGYLRRQGNAQEIADASVTLKLAATDITQFASEILGMRATITGGLGVGQYGYIDGFTFASKEATVRKDSDGTAGWDHLIPGTPLVAAFDLTTRYRIEPRVTVPAPAYSTSSASLFTTRSYVDMEFGNITESYTGVTGGGNVIWRDDDQLRVIVSSVISDVAIQFSAVFSANPTVPFDIKGRTSGATATVTAISANTDTLIEVDVESGGSSFQEDEEIDLILSSGTGDTFDGAAINAVFSVVRTGLTYGVTITNGGAGYTASDKITILGTALGGTTPANDLIITVGTVSDDSTSSILTFTSAGKGRSGRFVSLTNAENARWSDNGAAWTEVALPFVGTMTSLTAGNNRFIATASGESKVASSLTGVTWTEVALPLAAAWSDSVYGNSKFVIIASDDDRVLSSADGTTWTQGSIPNDTDGGADSTTSVWASVTYGKGKFVAISSSDGATASSTNGITWIRHDSAIDFNPDYVTYGNNRFVAAAAADGETAYSFDGITWYTSSVTLSVLGSITFQPNSIKYANGIFFIVGTDTGAATTVAFTSEDGFAWTERALPVTLGTWSALTYGDKKWFIKASAATTTAVAIVEVGARALLRTEVGVGSISEIRVLNPGSGYDKTSPPTVTITDPNLTTEVASESRIGNKVLAQPDFINRGAGYRSSTSTITITGDGFADDIPVGNTLTISGVRAIPGPGVQIKIAGVVDPNALEPGTLAVFSGVTVTDLGDDGLGNETKLVRFQISPRLDVEYVVPHGVQVTLQERYSQCRISGHDFLDIGTGNFTSTNYPAVYAGGAFFTAAPENEVYENNSGRVYYVSTDQDGNFRTGELFSVQQATGIVTISAEFFDLDGLSELALGGVRLGGSGTVVSEFSTDPTFAADSNNVIPTQRAIATFLQGRLSVGGESLEVNKLQAGRVLLGGTPENEINTNTGQYVIIPSDVIFDGQYTSDDGEGNVTTNQTAVSGTIVSQGLFLRPLDDTMQ
tara:strand:+ start:16 stop:5874 length:5859 start_codon:yes stop_codon:yes gene_type:complete